MDPILALSVVFTFAFLVEWVTERLFGRVFQGDAMIYFSAAVGILLCILFQIDIMPYLKAPTPIGAPYTGQVITGIIVGSGSSNLHKLLNAITSIGAK